MFHGIYWYLMSLIKKKNQPMSLLNASKCLLNYFTMRWT